MKSLDPDEVIRLDPENVEINKVLAQYFAQKVFHPKDLILSLSKSFEFSELLMRGVAFEVMYLDKPGWQKGKVKLELNFYPDTNARPSSSPLDHV